MIGNQYYLLYAFESQYQNGSMVADGDNHIRPLPITSPNEVSQKHAHRIQNDSTRSSSIVPIKSSIVGDVSEEAAFSNMSERAKQSEATCHKIEEYNRGDVNVKVRTASTDVKFLPEFGISTAIEKSLKDKNVPSWGQCKLPPTKACDSDKVSVILMAYNEEGLTNIVKGLGCCKDSTLYPRRYIDELILVWNGPNRESLESTKSGKTLKSKIESGELPMRFFVSSENGLENNLLNRYHPLVNPRNEAVLFFGMLFSYLIHNMM